MLVGQAQLHILDYILNSDWAPRGLAFLMDITGKLNSLNCELQCKCKSAADMISALDGFKAKINIFSMYLLSIY